MDNWYDDNLFYTNVQQNNIWCKKMNQTQNLGIEKDRIKSNRVLKSGK